MTEEDWQLELEEAYEEIIRLNKVIEELKEIINANTDMKVV